MEDRLKELFKEYLLNNMSIDMKIKQGYYDDIEIIISATIEDELICECTREIATSMIRRTVIK